MQLFIRQIQPIKFKVVYGIIIKIQRIDMSSDLELSNRNYIRQSPKIVNAKYSLNKSESDLIFALLTEVKKEDEVFKDYVFTVHQLEVKLGVKLHSAQLRKTVESLMSKVLKIYVNDNKWEFVGWFSYFGYDNGVVTCRFDKRLKPYFIELKKFILADIRHLVQMKSEYSRRIYLLLKEYEKFGERKFEVEELMNIFEVPKSLKIYNRFKEKVLLQAVKDINKFTDLEIKNIGTSEKPIYFEEIKFPRKVKTIIFYTKKNTADLKTFISWIRELYINVPLYANAKGQVLQCSTDGLLYYADTQATLKSEIAQKAWEWLHENREKLLCFKVSGAREEDREKRIENMKNGII